MPEIREKCAVFGIYNTDNYEAGDIVYRAMFSMQHRGQDGAGIAASDGKAMLSAHGLGLVGEALHDKEDRIKKMNVGQKVAIGHVRYATVGDAHNVHSLQPFVMHGSDGYMALAHNGHLVNSATLSQTLRTKGVLLHTQVDSELMMHLISRRLEYGMENALRGMMSKAMGSYALVIMGQDMLIGVRDPWGIRPLVLGKLGNSYVLSSETCALDVIGAEFIRDVAPGEVIIVDQNGLRSFIGQSEGEHLCVFEYVYLARADSTMGGVGVYGTRRRAGQRLAQVHPVEVDLVAGTPESSLPAALGYAQASGSMYGQALLKNPYVGRTFIQPTQMQRENAVKLKLTPLAENVKGKRIVLVDDSIVRGTTSIKIINMLRAVGAKEVHMRIASPPVRYPCCFGINTPSTRLLIGSGRSEEEICKRIGADTLAYLELDMLQDAVADGKKGPCGFCHGCFSGKYPLDIHKCKKMGC